MMKSISIANIGLLAALTAFALMGAVHAQDKMGKMDKMAPMDTMAPAKPYAHAANTWAKVQAGASDLDKIIKAGKLDDVHEIAFAIRDDLATLPSQSKALSPDRQKKLGGYVHDVGTTAELLDKYGDKGDAKNVKAQRSRMMATLKSVKALYPTGALNVPKGAMPSAATKVHEPHADHH